MRLPAAMVLAAGALVVPASMVARQTARGPAASAPRIDYLTFAQGAVPVSIDGAGAKLGATFEQAVRAVDGDPTGFTVVSGAATDTVTDFVYSLPAATTFDRLAVPEILETPSPSATFTRVVEVFGSAASATDGFVLLASGTLATHRGRGQVTELTMAGRVPVRWIRLRLTGGITILRPTSSFEFSEIIGNGSQETAAMATHFSGRWMTRALTMTLNQKGPVVTGCYDRAGDLTGTVTGNLLHATGLDRSDKTRSAFILSRAADGSLRGVRSSNNGPFRLYTVAPAPAAAKLDCANPAPPAIGCGSIIHGITFAYDSAALRPDAAVVLAALYDGLQSAAAKSIVIEGHTSSEGDDDYNLRLSERRAEAVVSDLIKRGLSRERVRSLGVGELRPIATNNDESGRSMNRRVEIKCQ